MGLIHRPKCLLLPEPSRVVVDIAIVCVPEPRVSEQWILAWFNIYLLELEKTGPEQGECGLGVASFFAFIPL